MKKVAVVTPIYKAVLNDSERFALQHGYAVLSAYEKIFVSPVNLEYQDTVRPDKVIRFPQHYFKNIAGYNRLMLSAHFYSQFMEYEYILVFQPDAFIFRDELIQWCAKGYAYIGAPWPGGSLIPPFQYYGTGYIAKYLPFILKSRKVFLGNGGLSLRNVRASLEILQKHRYVARFWTGNEDAFWSYYTTLPGANYPVPEERDASRFSLELAAEQYIQANGGELPFGCHGWEKYSAGFWSQIIFEAQGKVQLNGKNG